MERMERACAGASRSGHARVLSKEGRTAGR
jgi:hypothetical protein